MKIAEMVPGHFYRFDESRYGVFVGEKEVPNYYSWKKPHKVVVMDEWRVIPRYTSDGDRIPGTESVRRYGEHECVPAKVEVCVADDLETGKTFLWDRHMREQDRAARHVALTAEGEELKTRLDAQLKRLGVDGWSSPDVESDGSISLTVHLSGAEKIARLIEILERTREPR